MDGVKIGVTTDIRLTHLSIGATNQSWEDKRKQFVEKYNDNLPIDITNVDVCETFIFCHDQDIILEYEQSGKFNITYNIVFNNTGANPVRPVFYNTTLGAYAPIPRFFYPYLRATNITGSIANLTPILIDNYIPSGNTIYGAYANVGVTTPSGYITAGDLLKIRAGISSQMQNNLHYWRTAGGVNTRVDVNIDIP